MTSTYQPLTVAVGTGSITAKAADSPLMRLLTRITPADAFHQLSNLSTWFSKPGHEQCAIAFSTKAMEFFGVEMPVLDRHFALANQCITLYRWRETQPGALEGAIAACEASIRIHREAAIEAEAAMGIIPAHHCFRQLRIIEEKRGNYERAIELCAQAKAGGWADDWDKDIARLRKKIAKATSGSRAPYAACDNPAQLPPLPICIELQSPSPSHSPEPLPILRRILVRMIRIVTGAK